MIRAYSLRENEEQSRNNNTRTFAGVMYNKRFYFVGENTGRPCVLANCHGSLGVSGSDTRQWKDYLWQRKKAIKKIKFWI